MKIFLFYINGICGLEDWLDRKLVFPVESLLEEQDKLSIEVLVEDSTLLRKLNPGKNYALQFEHDNGSKELKYYKLKAFELTPPPKGEEKYCIILYAIRLEIEA